MAVTASIYALPTAGQEAGSGWGADSLVGSNVVKMALSAWTSACHLLDVVLVEKEALSCQLGQVRCNNLAAACSTRHQSDWVVAHRVRSNLALLLGCIPGQQGQGQTTRAQSISVQCTASQQCRRLRQSYKGEFVSKIVHSQEENVLELGLRQRNAT